MKTKEKDLGICKRCKKEKAVLIFAESFFHFSHGFTENLCQECYDKMQREHPLFQQGQLASQDKIDKLYKCSKCERETSMKFCVDCVQDEVKEERERCLKMIEKWKEDKCPACVDGIRFPNGEETPECFIFDDNDWQELLSQISDSSVPQKAVQNGKVEVGK